MGDQAYSNRRSVQIEYVPLILEMLLKDLQQDRIDRAIDFLDKLNISNEMLKEHLLDLCLNQKTREQFDKGLSTSQKTAFTKAWNQGHKDPTVGVKQRRGKATIEVIESDQDDEEYDGMIDEVELEEIINAKRK